MRTKLFALALLLISAATFAQSNSTAEVETALKEFLAENAASSYAFFKNRLTPDFRYINTKGAISSRDIVLKGSEGGKGVQSDVSDLKIFRSGDLAVVSGIHNFSGWRTGFTYTMEKQLVNGSPKWMFAASQHTPVQPVQTAGADEAAIKSVLEGHSQAASDGDVEKAVSYFANSPNVAISHQLPGSGYIRGYQAVTDGYRKELKADSFKKSTDKLTTGDYRYRIVGNTAFVTYVETFTKPDGAVDSRYHKANYLEKEGGQWKMIGNFWMPEQKAK